MTWLVIQVRSTPKTKLDYHDLFDRIRFMMMTKQDNNVTDGISVVYDENEIGLQHD